MSSNNVIEESFGCHVLTNDKLKYMLQKDTYIKYMNIVLNGEALSIEVADEIATVMKNWAISLGATHYAHWFQPLTGKTAAKYDSFLELDKEGHFITDLLGTELIKGESDASSFPSGGLRATFEARGYTIWDVTSPVFVKEHALYIPTIFYSYNDEVLDKKTPLLRSEQILGTYALKTLRLLGNTTSTRVISNVGAEQEYFLIDRDLYNKRKDIKFTGRTLLGKMPAKAQEDEDHYFAYLKTKVESYMQDLDIELWKLGIPAKTKHNEVAPSQHELAPLYTEVNIACDNNQLMMEVMKKVAKKHNMVCLLHEKPFDGVAGSGKHNNWSLSTDDGINLFKPGKDPEHNLPFLIFTSALVRGVDKHSDLLRFATVTSGNDLRLGGHEAPPCIISMFLGNELEDVFKKIAGVEGSFDSVSDKKMNIGVKGHQNFMKDTQDRNRTSPFAFTGNKFEFRMLPSSINLYTLNTIIHLIMIESLNYIVDRLQKADDKIKEAYDIVKDIMLEHNKVLFNGDNYSNEWIEEAKERGLLNLKDSSDVFDLMKNDTNEELFVKYGILSRDEFNLQVDVIKNDYVSDVNMEAKVLCEMIEQEILPCVYNYINELSNIKINITRTNKKLKLNEVDDKIVNLTNLSNELYKNNNELYELIADKKMMEDMSYCSKVVREKMLSVRKISDTIEGIIPKDKWAIPTYEDILYGI
ncbi:MAG: glutamine synthetase III [Clostridia bacterium]|nr:glutamine synthetase III [Clostridia bacterium]